MIKTQLSYNPHFAIELRSLTWYEWIGPEIYYELIAYNANSKITIRDSIKIAEFDGHSEYQPSMCEEILMFNLQKNGTKFRGVTKPEWKRSYRNYRNYMSQGRESSQPSMLL